jgi:hypothetical protein
MMETTSAINRVTRINVGSNGIMFVITDGICVDKIYTNNYPYFKISKNNIFKNCTEATVINFLSKIGLQNFTVSVAEFNVIVKFEDFNMFDSAAKILEVVSFCNKHGVVNCPDISCCLSLQTNKLDIEISYNNMINKVKIKYPSAYSEYDIKNYLVKANIHTSRSMRIRSDKDSSINKLLVTLKLSDVTKLVHDNKILPLGCSVSLDIDTSMKYDVQKLQSLNTTLEEYLEKCIINIPTIEIKNNSIFFCCASTKTSLIARAALSKLYCPTIINYDKSLLLHLTYSDLLNNISDDTDVKIVINIYSGQIIISGIPERREIAQQAIVTYFSDDNNILVEEIIKLESYDAKYWSPIKKYIMCNRNVIKSLGVVAYVLQDAICLRGPRHKVSHACGVIIDAIGVIINKCIAPCTNLNDDNSDNCVICYSPVISKAIISTCSCTYCIDCFKHTVLNSYGDQTKENISCVGCNNLIILTDLNLFTSDELWQIYKSALERYLTNNWKQYTRCLTPNCSGIYRVTNSSILYCKVCSNVYCLDCEQNYYGKRKSHNNLSCAEFKLANQIDSETLNWISKNTKSCPNCKIAIQKNDGCNHMTCYRCNYHFCWICLEKWCVTATHTYYTCA